MTTFAMPQSFLAFDNALLTVLGQKGVMRVGLSVLLCGLLACNTPSPYFQGLTAQRVTVEGSTFDVRVRGRLAEAIRVNPQYAPRLGPIEGRAAVAMQLVSGCEVSKVTGDQALLLGQLDCDGTGVTYVPGPPVTVYCDGIFEGPHTSLQSGYLDLDCAVY